MWLAGFEEVTRLAGVTIHEPSYDVRIDDPQFGPIGGEAPFPAYFEASEDWLQERRGHVRSVATTIDSSRVVGEFEVELWTGNTTISLPVAVVAEPDVQAMALSIRIYHSQWPLLGRHMVRLPLLAKDPSVRESDVVGEYQAALAAGDVEQIVATFEPDGCFREPAGGEFRVCGTDALRGMFTTFFGVGGGITLEHCTATEDGTRTALEFNAIRWGSTDMPPQAGIAVYERGPTGRIAEARVYDDVDPPLG